MALTRGAFRVLGTLSRTHPQWSVHNNTLSTSAVLSVGGKWRDKQGLDVNRNQFGPMKDLPDWTYLDGSLPPMTQTQKFKREQLKDSVATAVKLTKELERSRTILKEFKKDQHKKTESSRSRFKKKSS